MKTTINRCWHVPSFEGHEVACTKQNYPASPKECIALGCNIPNIKKEEIVMTNLNKMKKAELVSLVKDMEGIIEHFENLVTQLKNDLAEVTEANKDLTNRLELARNIYLQQNAVIKALRKSLDIATGNNPSRSTSIMKSIYNRADAETKRLLDAYRQRTQVNQSAATSEPSRPIFTDKDWAVSTKITFKGKKMGKAQIPLVDATCPVCGTHGVPIDEANYSHRKILAGHAVCGSCQRNKKAVDELKARVSGGHTEPTSADNQSDVNPAPVITAPVTDVDLNNIAF